MGIFQGFIIFKLQLFYGLIVTLQDLAMDLDCWLLTIALSGQDLQSGANMLVKILPNQNLVSNVGIDSRYGANYLPKQPFFDKYTNQIKPISSKTVLIFMQKTFLNWCWYWPNPSTPLRLVFQPVENPGGKHSCSVTEEKLSCGKGLWSRPEVNSYQVCGLWLFPTPAWLNGCSTTMRKGDWEVGERKIYISLKSFNSSIEESLLEACSVSALDK